MADKDKKGTSLGMWERAGRAMVEGDMSAMGHYEKPIDMVKAITQGYDAVKAVTNKVEANKNKSASLLKGFKNINVLKVPPSFQPQLKQWLITKRDEYVKWAEIISQGTDHPEYYNAVDQQSLIDEQLQSMDTQLNNRAGVFDTILKRQELENETPGKGRSAAMTNIQNTNFDNILQENYGPDGLDLQIVDNKLLALSLTDDPDGITYEYVPFDQLDVGSGYDNNPETAPNSIEAQFKAAMESVEDLALSGDYNDYDILEKERLKKSWTEALSKNPGAIIETIYNNKDFEPFLDEKIAGMIGVDYGSDKWEDFKAGILNHSVSKYEDITDLRKIPPKDAIKKLTDDWYEYIYKDKGVSRAMVYTDFKNMFKNNKEEFYRELFEVVKDEKDEYGYNGIMEMIKNSDENYTEDFVNHIMKMFNARFNEVRIAKHGEEKGKGKDKFRFNKMGR